MTTPIPATPVPVPPPVRPMRPTLWVCVDDPHPERCKRNGQPNWCAFAEMFDREDDAIEYAREHPNTTIFRLPGEGEKA